MAPPPAGKFAAEYGWAKKGPKLKNGAGLWILTKTGLDRENDVISAGIGLYFIGKAFFVGPMLLLVSAHAKSQSSQ
ncbi:MAG: hypothetical protein Q7J98_14170 [Kiritimatiellia bacterium]|nr:hypothetical protein [Kiritimatiellia bacterium]